VLGARKGSHRQYKHLTKPGRVTIAGHPKDDLAPGTQNNILRQAGLKDEILGKPGILSSSRNPEKFIGLLSGFAWMRRYRFDAS